MSSLDMLNQMLLEPLTPTARRVTEFMALACTSTSREKLEGVLKTHSISEPPRNHFTIEFLAILSLLPSSAGWRAIGSDVGLRCTAIETVNDQCKGVLAFFGELDRLRSCGEQFLTSSDLLSIVGNNDLCFFIGDALDYAQRRAQIFVHPPQVKITTRDLLLTFLDYEIPFWHTKPTPLACALWPNKESELCDLIHGWKDVDSELSIARSLTVEIRRSNSGYSVSLLSPTGSFSQFGINADVKSVSSSLFLPCKPPLFLQSEIAEFEEIINGTKQTRELRIQQFLENKSQFLRVIGFQGFAPQVHLIRQDIDSNPNKRVNLYPDFLLEDLGLGRFSILELKRAHENMSAGPADRRTFSAKLHRALSQLEDYSMFFEDSRNRGWFEEMYGIEISKPELILIMGNEGLLSTFPPKIAHTPLEGRPVRILTYDYILNLVRAHHLIFPDEGEDLERG
jgi:hypothetical protein